MSSGSSAGPTRPPAPTAEDRGGTPVLTFAIVGAGVMGTNHARVARSLPGVRIAYVVDPDRTCAERVAESCGAQPIGDLADVLGRVDCAIVASPSSQHCEDGVRLLRSGVHVLVEKPIATTPDEAAQLVAVAADTGVVVQVVHPQRFNPALLELDRLGDDLVHIDAVRISPYSSLIRIGVVLDLMI